MPMAAGDNPRGVSLAGVRLIPRRKEYSYDNAKGVLTTRVGCEAETIPAGAVTVPPAKPPTNNVDPEEWEPGLPDIDPLLPPPSGWWPPVLPPDEPDDTPTCLDGLEANSGGALQPNIWSLKSDEGDKLEALIWYPCTLRPSGVPHTSRITIDGDWFLLYQGNWVQDFGSDWWHVYAVDGGGNELLEGNLSFYPSGTGWQQTAYVDFSPASALVVKGFKIVLDARSATEWGITGDAIAAGSIAATNEAGVIVAYVAVGDWYAIQSTGGPFMHKEPRGGPSVRYQFSTNNYWVVDYQGIDGAIYSEMIDEYLGIHRSGLS